MEDQSPPSSPLLSEWTEHRTNVWSRQEMQAYCQEPNIALGALGNTLQKINGPTNDNDDDMDTEDDGIDRLLDNNGCMHLLPQLNLPSDEYPLDPAAMDRFELPFPELKFMFGLNQDMTDCATSESAGFNQDEAIGDSSSGSPSENGNVSTRDEMADRDSSPHSTGEMSFDRHPQTTSGVSDHDSSPQSTSGVSDHDSSLQSTSGVSDHDSTPQSTSGVSHHDSSPQSTSGVSDRDSSPQSTSGVSDRDSSPQSTSGVTGHDSSPQSTSGVTGHDSSPQSTSGVTGHDSSPQSTSGVSDPVSCSWMTHDIADPDSSIQSSSEMSNRDLRAHPELPDLHLITQSTSDMSVASSSDEQSGDVNAILDAMMCDSPISSLGDSEDASSVRDPELCEVGQTDEPRSDTRYTLVRQTEESSTSSSGKSTPGSTEIMGFKSEDHTYSSSSEATNNCAVMKSEKIDEIPGTSGIDFSVSVRMSRVKYEHLSSSHLSSDEESVETVNRQNSETSDISSNDNFVKKEDVQVESGNVIVQKIVVPASETGSIIEIAPSEQEQVIYVTQAPTGSDKKKTVKRKAAKRKAEPEVTPGPSAPKKAKKVVNKGTAPKNVAKERACKSRGSRKGHYPCKDCNDVFTQSSNLCRHCRQMHKSTPDIVCNICGYILKRQDYLSGHQRTKKCRAAAHKLKSRSINPVVSE